MTTFGKVTDGIGSYTISDGSTRWRVVYKMGRSVKSKGGFKTKGAAQHWQRHTLVARDTGNLVDAKHARQTVGAYAEDWLSTKANLRPSTAAAYDYLYRIHVEPTFGTVQFRDLDAAKVRTWHAKLLRTKKLRGDRTIAASSAAKAYRLLRQVCAAAVKEGYLNANPCSIDGAATEKVPDRLYKEPPSPAEVEALAAAVPARSKAMVLLAGYGGLRWGELAGLQRKHVVVDVPEGETAYVRIEQQLVDVNGKRSIEEPKTQAGTRRVYLHAALADALRSHLAEHVKARDSAYVFTSPKGEWLRSSNFRRNVWLPAVKKVGLTGLRFHDLRHAAATLAAETGATTANLMERMGHASPRAAMIYQHARDDRQRSIAAALDARFPSTPATPLRLVEGDG
jgi:integrase